MKDKFNDIKEAQYASNVREPLGKGYSRDYQWPDRAEGGSIAFGVGSKDLESAKEMIYPLGVGQPESKVVSDMYRKTHGNFAPGEQKNRNYDWKLDPNSHRFGYAEKKVLNGAGDALHNERNQEQFPKTIIVKKTVED